MLLGALIVKMSLTSVEYFCPVEGKWVISSPLSTPRLGLRAVVIEERIFVLGGCDGTERLSSVECYKAGDNGLLCV